MARTLGIELVDVDPDRVVATVEARAALSTSADAMHGGAIMAVADTLGAIGTVANMPRGARTTTIESKTNFFRAIPVGSTLTAESTPLHKGRTTQVWQTRLTGENGKLAALVTQTQMVLYPEGK
ncbi:MAG: PaaI family thioesterase [Rhodospirillaceae bacterium]|nr:PaaI family thioesterase [Rhodospirillaceae bacterium]MYB14100.1 PaaI family thioesterase [Rhodospirillaceae bacterium]MYI49622.1 PaaI family thioesterase [Rhodospirillaceae bacterium]